MTPYLRVHNALHGLAVDKVPFTTYTDFVKHDEEKQKALIERGMCVVRRTNSWKEVFRDTKVTKEEFFTEKGSRRIRTVWETPHGTLTSVVEPSGNTVWVREYPFKSPDDYPALRASFPTGMRSTTTTTAKGSSPARTKTTSSATTCPLSRCRPFFPAIS